MTKVHVKDIKTRISYTKLDFPRRPCVDGFPDRLDFHIVLISLLRHFSHTAGGTGKKDVDLNGL
ncbi:MAG TPA: hypothetical protein DD426_02685 [Clostridiaceae bacterium]|nr:hypothetical protein [Clostridiaceae bacterium]